MKRLNIKLMACVLTLACLTTGCQNKSEEIKNAKQELIDFCKKFPTSTYSKKDKIYLFDVTEDGSEDLCTNVLFGSGFTRNAVVVYDYTNENFYTLDGMYFDYCLEGIKNGRLEVVSYLNQKEDLGTIQIKNDELVFVSD